MNSFIPEKNKSFAEDVPYFEEISSEDGWEGHATTKSIASLKAEIVEAIERLGGSVISIQKGSYQVSGKERPGYQIRYLQNTSIGGVEGIIDIAALPVKNKLKKEKSEKMALYMARNALRGMWFLQKLSPGYAALMPFMLVAPGKTASQAFLDSNALMANVTIENVVEGDFEDDKD